MFETARERRAEQEKISEQMAHEEEDVDLHQARKNEIDREMNPHDEYDSGLGSIAFFYLDLRSVAELPVVRTVKGWRGCRLVVKCIMYILSALAGHVGIKESRAIKK